MRRDDLLTTRECADILGVSPGFIRGEIADGRLRAAVQVARPSRRTLYRVSILDLRAYCQQWSPVALERIPA